MTSLHLRINPLIPSVLHANNIAFRELQTNKQKKNTHRRKLGYWVYICFVVDIVFVCFVFLFSVYFLLFFRLKMKIKC